MLANLSFRAPELLKSAEHWIYGHAVFNLRARYSSRVSLSMIVSHAAACNKHKALTLLHRTSTIIKYISRLFDIRISKIKTVRSVFAIYITNCHKF